MFILIFSSHQDVLGVVSNTLTHFCTFALSPLAYSSRLRCSLYTFDVIYSLRYPYKQFCPVLGSQTGHG